MVWLEIIRKIRGFQPRLRLFFGLSLFIFVLIFLYLKVVPSGRISYSRDWPRGLASGKGFIYDFKPGERLDISNPDQLRMIGDPLYFSLFTPRAFSTAKVTVNYRERLASTTPIIELGVLKDKVTGSYELKPLENKIIDGLRSEWRLLPNDDLSDSKALILQADNDYESREDFLTDLNQRSLKGCSGFLESCLAIYNYQFDNDYRLTRETSLEAYTFDQPIRGSHQLYLYLPAGSQELKLSVVDLNLDKESDPVTVRLSRRGQEVVSRSLIDEREEIIGVSSAEMSLVLPFISAEGLYKLDIRASDDIVISSLALPSDRFVFINRIWPVSGPGNLRLFTDSSYLQIKTFNPASLGTISYGGKDQRVAATYQQINLFSDQTVSEIFIPKDDLILETNGIFSLTRAGVFNPAITKVDRFFKPGEKVKYIIANYQEPRSDGDFKQATVELSLTDAHRENGKYTFLISVPGLGAETPHSFLEINKITVELRGISIWQKIKSWL